MPTPSFADLGLNEQLLKSLAESGFTAPTAVQELAIPQLLKSEQDSVVLAQTGTGKTAAYGLPLLQQLDPSVNAVQALILSPTRELCMQITKDFDRFAKYMKGIKSVAVYGGAPIRDQIRDIRKGAQIVVATPGRLLDLLGREAIDLALVDIVVLDEADEMLNMGFQEDLTAILETTRKDKRTWLFSATMGSEVRRIAKRYMREAQEINVGRTNTTAEAIDHRYCVVQMRDRYAALTRFVDATPDLFAIVFCRTKHETQELAEHLMKDGYNADAIHGDLSQQQRDRVMARYRSRQLQLLIATDVAARGIDVQDITHVIHFDLPGEAESYTHRSGRTARAGRSGISLSIIGQRDIGKVRQLERSLKTHFTYMRVPGGAEICERQLLLLIQRIKDVEIDEEGIAGFMDAVRLDLEKLSKEELIKRVVSIEFNRFLEIYRGSMDLNVDMSQKDHTRRPHPGAALGEPRERFAMSGSMFINLGTVDGFDKGRMLGYICGITGMQGDSIGRITLKDVYSFVDIEASQLSKAMAAFQNANYKGRPVRVDLQQGSNSGGAARPRQEGTGGFREERAPFKKKFAGKKKY